MNLVRQSLAQQPKRELPNDSMLGNTQATYEKNYYCRNQ